MRPVTKVILAIAMIATFGFGSIVAGEYLREGSFDMQEVKYKIKRIDIEIIKIVKNPIEYFK